MYRQALALRPCLGQPVNRLASVIIASAVLAVTLSVSATAATAAISTPPHCGGPFNPYDYTPSALSACGIKTFPLTSVTGLPDGGLAYNYDMGGGVIAHFNIAPSGFDPATATDQQLAEYGFPARPTDPTALAAWQQEVSTLHVEPPPPFLVELSTHASASRTSGRPGTHHRSLHPRHRRSHPHSR